MGGTHHPREATVNLDTLGLTAGETHEMRIFHAERHMDESHFRVDTTISCFQPPPE